MCLEDDGILLQDMTTAVFYDPCQPLSSALTAPSVAASLPGLARHIESPDTPPTDEQTDQSNTGTGYGFEVLSSSGERESQTVAWY